MSAENDIRSLSMLAQYARDFGFGALAEDLELDVAALRAALPLVGLPPPDTRWSAKRKAALLDAINAGLITRRAACAYYGLSSAELAEWESRYRDRHIDALKVTRRAPPPERKRRRTRT